MGSIKSFEPPRDHPVVDKRGIADTRWWTFWDQLKVNSNSSLDGGDDILFKTANYSMEVEDKTIFCSGNFTVTLVPVADGIVGKRQTVKNDGTGIITVKGSGSELIEGENTAVLKNEGESIDFINTGTEYIIV